MRFRGLRSFWNVLTVTALVGFAVSLLGCASAGPVTPVAVSDAKSVAGTWKGMVYQSGVAPDYVTLTIRDDGSYDFKSVQTIGTSQGSGKIAISDGRIRFEGVKGYGVGTLQRNPAGDLVMAVEGTLSDGSTLTAKLWPSK
jgi:hypothetical protein